MRGALVAVLVLLAAAAPAAAEVPAEGALYHEGQDGRYLLGGTWLFRADPRDDGRDRGWHRSRSADGWTPVTVPNAWNVGDGSGASMIGGVGWYRKDFELPAADAAAQWLVRFESVNQDATIWLNGRKVGRHRGAYLPFERALDGVSRAGTNRLVVRVDSRRRRSDFPPMDRTASGAPTGGWFNFGGIVREVYLRRVRDVDIAGVQALPTVPCGGCGARVRLRVTLRNHSSATRTVAVEGSFGDRAFALGSLTLRPGRPGAVSGSGRVPSPRLWSPADPQLYDAVVTAGASTYRLRTGIRTVSTGGGVLRVNGAPVRFEGLGFHEDRQGRGSALTNADREWLVAEARALGADFMRTHYPPHPHLHELADRAGILIWSEIPVYQMQIAELGKPRVRRRAVKLLRENIRVNGNHPSVVVWSVGNELTPEVGPGQAAYLRAAERAADRLDPTRPSGIAVVGYPSVGCQRGYAPIDVIGLNQYFGWYLGPYGEVHDRRRLSAYLDRFRSCYSDKAVAVTEFGAEANREGPAEERGTYAFQAEWVDYQMRVLASKPWLSGVSYWTLNEFWVRPGWSGGNPRPASPLHQKGLVGYDGVRKPAWHVVQRHYGGPRP